jgi:peptidoglycan/LPS O-acetylase OafA/YrhL
MTALPPEVDKKRYNDLDALRAFAMLSGVVLHALISFMPGTGVGWTNQDRFTHEGYAITMHVIHGFRMPLFFLVSGFFTAMMLKNRGLNGLVKHRFQRILLPMILFLAVLYPLIIMAAVAGGISNSVIEKESKQNVATLAIESESTDGDGAPFDEDERLAYGPILYGFSDSALLAVMILSFAPLFHHLWFLYYLLWLIGGFVVCALIAQKLKIKVLPDWLVSSPLRLLWLIPLTFVPQFFMATTFGPDTAGSFVPWPPKLLYYAIFFGFGALCFSCPDYEKWVGRRWIFSLVLALPALLAGLYFFKLRTELFHAGLEENWNQIMFNNAFCALFTVTYTWLTIFGLIGFFRTYFSGESKTIRFVSDSSYWLYLMHLPLVMLLQAIVGPLFIPSIVKFMGICAVTSVVLLFMYRYMVRYTWVGTMLNGKKRKPGEPEPTPPPPIIEPANQEG